VTDSFIPDTEQLAYKIADEAAESALECNCNVVAVAHGRVRTAWLNLALASAEAQEAMQRDARYLELRGKLERHPVNSNLVQLKAITVRE